MKSCDIKIRVATPKDAEALLKIYAPYVEQTAITFEYDIPTVDEFANRISGVLKKYPYLVAEQSGEAVGYAYVNSFHSRAAYAWAVETSIYIMQGLKGQGIGGKLHQALETILKEQGLLNMNACIAYPQEEDAFLTKNSVAFHKHMGYRWVGEFQKCGYKFDRWYNMVWMEKHIGNHGKGQAAPKTFEEIRNSIKEKYAIE